MAGKIAYEKAVALEDFDRLSRLEKVNHLENAMSNGVEGHTSLQLIDYIFIRTKHLCRMIRYEENTNRKRG